MMPEIPVEPTIAERAALRVLEVNGIEREDNENALSALGWAMGRRISYEDAMFQLANRAVEFADPRTLSFTAGDVVVSHFDDESGQWTHVELTEAVEDSDEWRTVASLLLSDVEAADLARRLTDRTIS